MTSFDITLETAIDIEHAERFYDLYVKAFGRLRVKAAARQVLHQDEFFEEMIDERVWKIVAWSATGEPIGLATITRELDTVPWISPEFFRSRYPEHAARNAIFYLGFILVRPQYMRSGVFEELLSAGRHQVMGEGAVCAWDLCAYNRDLGFAERIETLLHRWGESEVTAADTQTYYAVRYF